MVIGGDDTLSYGARLIAEDFPVWAIPKTMDNDVPGTDYCIGLKGDLVSRSLGPWLRTLPRARRGLIFRSLPLQDKWFDRCRSGLSTASNGIYA